MKQGRFSLSNEEADYIAHDALVTIVPRFKGEEIYLIASKLGPFKPNIPVTVPLWLALVLKQTRNCTIELSEWLQLENISGSSRFQVPASYIEQARSISKYLVEDTAGQLGLESKLDHILALRQNEMRAAFYHLNLRQAGNGAYQLPPTTSTVELNLVRRFNHISMKNRMYEAAD